MHNYICSRSKRNRSRYYLIPGAHSTCHQSHVQRSSTRVHRYTPGRTDKFCKLLLKLFGLRPRRQPSGTQHRKNFLLFLNIQKRPMKPQEIPAHRSATINRELLFRAGRHLVVLGSAVKRLNRHVSHPQSTFPPSSILLIPFDGAVQPFIKTCFSFPTQQLLRFVG